MGISRIFFVASTLSRPIIPLQITSGETGKNHPWRQIIALDRDTHCLFIGTLPNRKGMERVPCNSALHYFGAPEIENELDRDAWIMGYGTDLKRGVMEWECWRGEKDREG